MNKTLIKLDLNNLRKDTKRFIEDIQKEPDRSVPIVAVAFLDDVLNKLLEKYFINDKKVIKRILEYPGALNNFAARADIAYCLGIVPPKAYQDIVQIRKIRNKFSHSHFPVSFNEKDISNMCTELNYYKMISQTCNHEFSAREQFMITAIMLVDIILSKALSIEKSKTSKDYTIAKAVTV